MFVCSLYLWALFKPFILSSWSVSPSVFWNFGSSLLSLHWNLFWVDCLSLLLLVVIQSLYPVPSSGTYSSTISFCLNFCLYFYACGRFITFLDFVDVAHCRWYPMYPSSILPSQHPRAGDWPVPGWVPTCVYGPSSSSCRIVVFLLLVSVPWWVRLV